MSRYERHGTRSLVYSKWHRLYLADEEKMIDVDGVEYCRYCRKALVLIETARDIGQPNKTATVLGGLGASAQVLTLCVLYQIDKHSDNIHGCPCDPPRRIDPSCGHGISRFRVRAVWPQPQTSGWITLTPEQFRDALRVKRMEHYAADHRMWNPQERRPA